VAAGDVDSQAIAELRAIAADAREAVDKMTSGGNEAPEGSYRSLQLRAAALNAEYRWASHEEFETLLPTLEARAEMDALNERHDAGRSDPDRQAAVHDLLVRLWAWAKGVLVAYEPGLE
jgi:hypothetical protein